MILEIRAARGDESALAARIAHDVWHETHAGLQDPAIAAYRTPLFFADRIDELDQPPLLAMVDEHPAGMASWQGDDLLQLFVLPHWRGMGVGRRLDWACEDMMAETGVELARLWCVCGNAGARQFYEKCNWRLSGLNSQSVESVRGPVNVLHWAFEKRLARPAAPLSPSEGNGIPG
jgi:GNAT superfamily N-acetyltransferase